MDEFSDGRAIFGAMTLPGCSGLVGLLFGHDYQARYSLGETKLSIGAMEGPASAWCKIIEASKPQTYCGDVCTRCGHVVNGKQEPV